MDPRGMLEPAAVVQRKARLAELHETKGKLEAEARTLEAVKPTSRTAIAERSKELWKNGEDMVGLYNPGDGLKGETKAFFNFNDGTNSTFFSYAHGGRTWTLDPAPLTAAYSQEETLPAGFCFPTLQLRGYCWNL